MDLSVITSFVTLMLAASIAVERMVEVLKGWFPSFWLFKPSDNKTREANRCAWIHVLAGLCGIAVAWAGQIDSFAVLKLAISTDGHSNTHWCYWTSSRLITGLLASGGSAFWNHALDLIKATKVQQEEKAGI